MVNIGNNNICKAILWGVVKDEISANCFELLVHNKIKYLKTDGTLDINTNTSMSINKSISASDIITRNRVNVIWSEVSDFVMISELMTSR